MSISPQVSPLRHCEHCGSIMERKRYATKLECMANFLRRHYCDRACMAASMMKKEPTRSAIQMRLRKTRGSSCEVCGSTANLHSHHNDRNWRNNDPSNIATLCGSCHLKRHWREMGGLFERQAPGCSVCGVDVKRLRRGMCHYHYWIEIGARRRSLTRLGKHG